MTAISTHDPCPRRRVRIVDSEMAYVSAGERAPVVLLHGNPTSSYLWRNVIPWVEPVAHCVAPEPDSPAEIGQAVADFPRRLS